MKQNAGLLVAIALVLPMSTALADASVLVEDDNVAVTADDLRALAELQVPEQKAPFFWGDEGAIRDSVANLFLVRRVAEEARANGLHEQEQWAVDYFADRALMNLQIRKVTRERVEEVDIEALAEEHYRAHPDKFTRPEEVRASHILVSMEERTDDEALALAEQIMSDLEADPERFEALVEEHSDDPSAERNNGNLGFFSRGRMAKPFEEAAFGLEEPGELVGPVKTQFGYHIIRLEDRRAQSKQPFEVVKAKLMEQERSKVESRAKEEYLSRIRSAEDIQSNQEAIKAMVEPLPDPKELVEQKKGAPTK